MSTFVKVKFQTADRSMFFPTLRQRVDDYFKEKNMSKHANVAMVVKTFVLLAAYIIPFTLFLTLTPSLGLGLLLWAIMGFAKAGIGMSIMHDANHDAYSANKKMNFLIGSTLNLCGGSSFTWKLQHNVLHHTYTNITHMDEDIADKGVLRFSPHTPVRGMHRFQWIYAFFFYGILTLYWVVLKDFVQFARYTRIGLNTNTRKENIIVMTKIVLVKILYIFAMLIAPIFIFHIPAYIVISGFLLMHFIAGNILTIVFQLAHTVDETTHPMPDEEGVVQNDWAIHQMNTTVNFSRYNKFLSWYLGGLNFQVEHHLFPRISHVHYPALSEIVKSTAEEFNIPYLENKTFFTALQSHIKALKKFGRLPNINEALA